MMGGVVVRAFVCAGFIISHIGTDVNQGRHSLCCFGALGRFSLYFLSFIASRLLELFSVAVFGGWRLVYR